MSWLRSVGKDQNEADNHLPTRLLSFRSVALSKDLDDEETIESPTTASFVVWTEQRSEKPWIVLDMVVEEDEFDEIAIEDRRYASLSLFSLRLSNADFSPSLSSLHRTTSPTTYSPIRSSYPRTKTPSLFYLP